jgi:hypothetical protein
MEFLGTAHKTGCRKEYKWCGRENREYNADYTDDQENKPKYDKDNTEDGVA